MALGCRSIHRTARFCSSIPNPESSLVFVFKAKDQQGGAKDLLGQSSFGANRGEITPHCGVPAVRGTPLPSSICTGAFNQRSIRAKSTISWLSRALPAVHLLGPSAVSNRRESLHLPLIVSRRFKTYHRNQIESPPSQRLSGLTQIK